MRANSLKLPIDSDGRGVVCIVQDHGALEVPQMALKVRVPFEWSDGWRCKPLRRWSSFHLVGKGRAVNLINCLAQGLLRASFESETSELGWSLGRRLRCLERDWLTSSSVPKGRSPWLVAACWSSSGLVGINRHPLLARKLPRVDPLGCPARGTGEKVEFGRIPPQLVAACWTSSGLVSDDRHPLLARKLPRVDPLGCPARGAGEKVEFGKIPPQLVAAIAHELELLVDLSEHEHWIVGLASRAHWSWDLTSNGSEYGSQLSASRLHDLALSLTGLPLSDQPGTSRIARQHARVSSSPRHGVQGWGLDSS
ncbi:unnamed protein product [Prunus armeniaca]